MPAVFRRERRSVFGATFVGCYAALMAGTAPAQTPRPLGDYRTVQATLHQIIARDAGLTPAEQAAALRSQIALTPASPQQGGKKPWQIDLPLAAAAPPQPLAQVTWQATSHGAAPLVRWQPNAWLSAQQQQAVSQVTGRVADYMRGQVVRQRGPLTRDLKVKVAKTTVSFAAKYLAVKLSRRLAYKIAGEVVTFTFDYFVK